MLNASDFFAYICRVFAHSKYLYTSSEQKRAILQISKQPLQ